MAGFLYLSSAPRLEELVPPPESSGSKAKNRYLIVFFNTNRLNLRHKDCTGINIQSPTKKNIMKKVCVLMSFAFTCFMFSESFAQTETTGTSNQGSAVGTNQNEPGKSKSGKKKKSDRTGKESTTGTSTTENTTV